MSSYLVYNYFFYNPFFSSLNYPVISYFSSNVSSVETKEEKQPLEKMETEPVTSSVSEKPLETTVDPAKVETSVNVQSNPIIAYPIYSYPLIYQPPIVPAVVPIAQSPLTPLPAPQPVPNVAQPPLPVIQPLPQQYSPVYSSPLQYPFIHHSFQPYSVMQYDQKSNVLSDIYCYYPAIVQHFTVERPAEVKKE